MGLSSEPLSASIDKLSQARLILDQHCFGMRDSIIGEFELTTQSLHLQIDIIVDDHTVRRETILKRQVGFGALFCILQYFFPLLSTFSIIFPIFTRPALISNSLIVVTAQVHLIVDFSPILK